MNSPKILFGILSSRDTVQAITTLADLLYPHQIVVHHDFTKFADFKIERENVFVLPDPVVTGWGGWSLVDATIKLMRVAKAQFEFDYFQLLSETCLPVQPVKAFETYLAAHSPQAMIDLQPICSPADPAFLSHGWRYYPRGTFCCNIAKKLIYMARDLFTWQQRGLINLKVLRSDLNPLEKLIAAFIRVCYQTWWHWGRFPFANVKYCAVGGQWFGLSRNSLEKTLAFIDANTDFVYHYQHVHIPDESFFQTIIYALKIENIYPASHTLFWHSNGNGPDFINLDDLGSIHNDVYFSRKFSLSTEDLARNHIVNKISNLRLHGDI